MSKILIFDLSEVIIMGLTGIKTIVATRLGVDVSSVGPALGGEPLVDLCKGLISERTYWERVRASTQWDLSVADLQIYVRSAFQETVPGMPALVQTLSGSHQLILLSDHGAEWMAHIDGIHPFLQVFHRRFISHEMGQTKREIETYRRVLGELEVDPESCVFIDDLTWNIERARSIGMTAFLFESEPLLRQQLAEIGVTVEQKDCRQGVQR